MEKRTYLTILPDNRTVALRAAGKLANGENALEYDRSQKLWFAKDGADLERIKDWLPENTTTGNTVTVGTDLSPREEFAKVLEEAGFVLSDLPHMDGKMHRVATKEDTHGKKSGVYRGYLDGRPAGWYQNHRASEGKVNWTSTGSFTWDPADAVRQKALQAQKRWDREQKEQTDFARMSATLTRQWEKMPPPVPDHAYLVRKGVPATDGVRQDKYGNLVIPLRNTHGDIRSLQYIDPEGKKNLKKDAEKTGNFFVVGGALVPGMPVLYAEGYATAASLNMATGLPVVMTVDAGNMVTVSQKIKDAHPDVPHIILGEDDFTRKDNKGLLKAEEAARNIGGMYVIPTFTDSERAQAFAGTASFSDFNDIHAARGLDAVRDQLAPVLDPLLPQWRQIFSEENTMPGNFKEGQPETPVSETTTGLEPNKVELPKAEHETITLYHGSPATFSAIDSEKIGLGQNFVGRGFYTDTSILGVHYAMEEINHKDYHVYELEIPSTAIILDRSDSSSLTDELRERIREAGKTVHQRLTENGEASRSELGEKLADSKNIDETFLMFASSPQGMSILKEAGIDALKDNSYVAIVNTDLIDNVRLRSAGGNIKAEMTQYIDKALGDVAQDASRLSNILQEEPIFSKHYDAIRSELVTLATAQNKPEEAERLTSLLTHTLVETIDSNPDRKTHITPLNRLYAEAIRSLDLNHNNSAATLGHLIDSAVVNMSPDPKRVAEPDKPEPAAPEPVPLAEQNTQESTPESEVPEQPRPDPTPLSAPKTEDLKPSESATLAPENVSPVVENGFAFTFGRQPGDVSPDTDTPVATRLDLDELLQGLTSRQDGNTWIYALDGQDAFRDYGDRIVMATPEASDNDRMIVAALLSAKANHRGAVEVTGSPEFISKALTLIADNNIEVHLKNPEQRAQFDALLASRNEQKIPENGMTMTPQEPGPVSEAAPAAQPVTAPTATTAPVDTAPVAPVAADMPAQPVPPMSVIERETLRAGLTGKLMEAGPAPYQFDPKNTPSYYVTLRTKQGAKTYWGVELGQALADSGKQRGDMIKLQHLGKKPVTVNVPVKNEQGVVTGFTPHETHRNQWTITPAVNNQLLTDNPDKVAPAQLAAYDGNAFWQVQAQVVQQANLPLATPDAQGHSLLYTGPDGKGQPAPEQPPANTPVPAPSKAAGSLVMQAFDDNGQLLAHLVKGNGDYLQGVVRHENELQHVLARLCTASNGDRFLALNTVRDDGSLSLIGHASPVNQLKGAEVNYDTFAFRLTGKDAPKFAVPLVSPEKIPPALHSKLGFTQAYTPPKAEEAAPQPRQQAKPAMQHQPM